MIIYMRCLIFFKYLTLIITFGVQLFFRTIRDISKLAKKERITKRTNAEQFGTLCHAVKKIVDYKPDDVDLTN